MLIYLWIDKLYICQQDSLLNIFLRINVMPCPGIYHYAENIGENKEKLIGK